MSRRSILAGMPSANLNHVMPTIEAAPINTRSHPSFKDRTGIRYGKLVAKELHGRVKFPSGQTSLVWLFECDCGKTVALPVKAVHGSNISCGCFQKERMRARAHANNFRHGHTRKGLRSSTYASWQSMIQRCENTNMDSFTRYGGRGIKVCDRWRVSFNDFLKDMGERPSREYSVDRIDNSKGYDPSNCRWATRRQQCQNRASSRIITIGSESMCGAEWSRKSGIPYASMMSRIRKGWDVTKAIFTPVR